MQDKRRTSNKCPHCGGWMYPDYDGLTCLICARQVFPKGYKAIGEVAFEEPSKMPRLNDRIRRPTAYS